MQSRMPRRRTELALLLACGVRNWDSLLRSEPDCNRLKFFLGHAANYFAPYKRAARTTLGCNAFTSECWLRQTWKRQQLAHLAELRKEGFFFLVSWLINLNKVFFSYFIRFFFKCPQNHVFAFIISWRSVFFLTFCSNFTTEDSFRLQVAMGTNVFQPTWHWQCFLN